LNSKKRKESKMEFARKYLAIAPAKVETPLREKDKGT
jgi:hypothetical protein